MRGPALAAAALLTLALAPACGSRGGLYTQRLAPLPVVATLDALVEVVPQTGRAVVVPADGSSPRALPISPGARVVRALPDGDTVAILAGTLKVPVLDLLKVSDGTVTTLTVPGPFDTMTASPEGDWLVLTYSATGRIPGLAARNLNEIAVVDLVSQTVERMQLDTESLAPRMVVFGPSTAPRRLVAVGLDRGVAVFDPRTPAVPARRIALRPAGSTAETSVLEAAFSPNADWLFVRASGVDDVIVIELGEAAGTHEITASVNFVAGGSGLTDIAVPGIAALPDAVLAVYAASREVLLLDARGIEDKVLRLPLADPLTGVHVLGGRALISDARYRTVVAWDPVTGLSGSAVLDAGFDVRLFSDGMGRAMFGHPSIGGGGSSLSVVSVEDGVSRLRVRLQSIQLSLPASTVSLDDGGQRLFFIGRGDTTLVGLDLRTLELAQVTLDAQATSLFHLPGSDTVAVVHSGNDFGDVTLLPATGLDRGLALRVRDFALTGDLDRPYVEGAP
ncbi:MAG: hypothetical protein ACYC8T_25360 [Myxococcaceae bacterium]